MNTIWAIVGVLALLVAVADVVHHWKTRGLRKPKRDEFCYQDWETEERRRRMADGKAPAVKGFQRLRRRSS